MNMNQLKFLLLLLFIYKLCKGQESVNCGDKQTCDGCIEQLGCVWCIAPNNRSKGILHCMHEHSASPGWCPNGNLVSPSSSLQILENQPLSSQSSNPVQISPQRIKISARKNEKIQIDFKYQQAENYPVDLYFLMDLSASMETNRETLGQVGLKLAQQLLNLTKNVRLGFGSFVDKVDLPFVNTDPVRLNRPCSSRFSCVPPYSFINHLDLTHIHQKFEEMVQKAIVSGNIDRPEGGFDALMQVMVCKEEIGWRDQARRLIVFSTDNQFHVAGDGILAGVLEPNDAKCHMKDHKYTEYLKYDYPSISQINYVAKQNNMNIIFAVVKPKDNDILESYQNLYQEVDNSNMGILEKDGKNVIDLVIDNYNKIVDSVIITSNASSDVGVKISALCRNPKENGCNNVHVGETIHFSATIQPLQCSDNNKKFIAIKPSGLKESLVVELDILCECPCSSATDPSYQKNSESCNRGGDLTCGVCSCHPDRLGRNCECDSSSFDTEDTSNCQKHNSTEICSGLGVCKCGKCQCETRADPSEEIYGKYCECNNYSCRRANGEICSGRGTCDCGNCMCNAGWRGDACQCPKSNQTCMASGSQEICSGRGQCNCGVCECSDSKKYSGKYCEECTSCPAKRCNQLKDCVECQTFGTGLYSEEICLNSCTSFKTEVVDELKDTEDGLVKRCEVPDNSSCTIVFEYWYGEEKTLMVRAQREKNCPKPLDVLAWIGGVIGSILLAGLVMLIIWKICTTYHDRRQYEKFEKEKQATRWHNNTNPLYRGATTTFQNPAYNRSSRLSTKS